MYSNLNNAIISTNMNGKVKASLVCTVLNEENNIEDFIDSVAKQTVLPDEFIIVDGGSSDKTVEQIKNQISKSKYKRTFKLIIKKGNRSIGRNEGIKKSSNNIILLTDAGCLLDKNWIENIIKPFENQSVDVVAGYYKGKYKNIFQKSLIPYVLVMKDKVDPNTFLPATRSMALRKYVWEKLKGFDEKLSHNEDYAFANKVKKAGFTIRFEKKAIVYWFPRKNLLQAFKMFFRFSYGDAESGILRTKVIFLFLRYIFGIYFILLVPIMKSILLNSFILTSFLSYITWSISKNYKYVKDLRGVIYLPLLQFTSDLAVLLGTTFGFIKTVSLKKIVNYFKENKRLSIVLVIYSVTMLSIIGYGIPNASHPFNYFMDEWHQGQAVRNLFTQGSPNIEGSANGSIFQFFLTGLYLVPFIVFGIVNPFAIKSSVLQLDVQYTLFEILRLNTLFFGLASILLFYYICKKYFQLNTFTAIFFFVFNPVWIMLSNYYKYDIALMFWILLSFLFFLRYSEKQNFLNYLLAGIFSALALSTKLSPLPLLLVYILIYFMFTKDRIKNISWLIAGLFLYTITFIAFGIPDIILGKGNLTEYLNSNLLETPALECSNIILPTNLWIYLTTDLYPSIFGHIFYFGFVLSFVGFCLSLRKNLVNNKANLVLFMCLILFLLSLYPLKIGATNNRVLVLLPFMVIFLAGFINWFLNKLKRNLLKLIILTVIMGVVVIQIFETYSWVYVKLSNDPRQTSSEWILKNISKGEALGIENIPIYQSLPDIVLKEFYLKQYAITQDFNYNYVVLSSYDKKYPNFIIMTNDEFDSKYLIESESKSILKKIKKQNYRKISQFTPDFKYLNLFTNDLNYQISGLIQAPITVSIYEKK
ncbi:MAG: hypothetical protein COU25_03825 [Candidatus Levybacteria bacterium CG10_big_fil_rev_8_21_14_0_10_35_13]|nr:MAG: hypothetical protein COU25_03825 [Candidatus Levybacteria bacterium CG10_big_fil_rev_8_21_14_0_10_35_13]